MHEELRVENSHGLFYVKRENIMICESPYMVTIQFHLNCRRSLECTILRRTGRKPYLIWFLSCPTQNCQKMVCRRGLVGWLVDLCAKLWCSSPFQQYFSYIVAISFIGGGNRSTWRKPPTCRKSLTNFIT